MNRPASPARIGYFGKIPARSDFIKAAQDVPLMGVLDHWLAQVMQLLAADPRWKQHYDTLTPLNFAFVGPRRRHAIGGHILASRDQSGRRFPFLMMRTLEVPDNTGFVGRSPLVLAPLWDRLELMARDVLNAADPMPALHVLTDTVVALDAQCSALDASMAEFLRAHTLISLDRLLGPGLRARQLILALGLLLQPVRRSAASRLERSLVLPLPEQLDARYLVAALWLHLIVPFLDRADFELALFLTRIDDRPSLVVGFCGASALTLHAIIDPHTGREHQICFDELDWVDDQLAADHHLRALASQLDQPRLSLQLARELFIKTFTGG